MTDPEIQRLVWRASLALEQGDRLTAADFLERAAQLLRREGGEPIKQTSPGTARQ